MKTVLNVNVYTKQYPKVNLQLHLPYSGMLQDALIKVIFNILFESSLNIVHKIRDRVVALRYLQYLIGNALGMLSTI